MNELFFNYAIDKFYLVKEEKQKTRFRKDLTINGISNDDNCI